jgi:flagellar hook-length control protein FliK
MSALSALLTAAASPGAPAASTGAAADAAGATATVVGAEAQAGSLTLMFQQLLAAALNQQPQSSTAGAASAQLPAVLESLTAQIASATGGKSSAAGSGKVAGNLEDADPTDVAALAAALLAALQFTQGTPLPAPGGAHASASDTADAAIDAAPELTAALAQLLNTTAGTGGDTAKPNTPLAILPTAGDATPAPGAVDLQARPAGNLALPALIEAMKIPDDSLRGASADASPTQHVLEPLGAATAAVISQPASDGGAQSTAPVERTVTVPMQHPAWTEAVASQVKWCVDEGVQSARLQITPEHLGPVEIKLELADGKVNVNFGASHAETRAALEQSIPRLRELMSGAGLSLGEATVQQQMRQESRNPASQTPGSDASSADDGFVPLHRVLGLVDEYA